MKIITLSLMLAVSAAAQTNNMITFAHTNADGSGYLQSYRFKPNLRMPHGTLEMEPMIPHMFSAPPLPTVDTNVPVGILGYPNFVLSNPPPSKAVQDPVAVTNSIPESDERYITYSQLTNMSVLAFRSGYSAGKAAGIAESFNDYHALCRRAGFTNIAPDIHVQTMEESAAWFLSLIP